MTAGAPPAAVTIQRIEDELGWVVTQIYGLTETAPAISICEPRPEHAALVARPARDDQGAAGRRVDHLGRVAGGRRPGPRSARRRDVGRRNRRPRQRHHGRLLQRSGGDREVHGRRLVSHRRCGGGAPRWLRADHRSPEGRDHQRRREHLIGRSGSHAAAARGHPGSGRGRLAEREVGRVAPCVRGVQARGSRRPPRRCATSVARTWRTSRCRTDSRRLRELPKTATGKIQKFVLRKGRPNITAQ